jgi:hypothetical protein
MARIANSLTTAGRAGNRASDTRAVERALTAGTAQDIDDQYFEAAQDAQEFCQDVVRAAREAGVPVKPYLNLIPVHSMQTVSLVLEGEVDVKPIRAFWDALHAGDDERLLKSSRRHVAQRDLGIDAEGNASEKLRKNLNSKSKRTALRALEAFGFLKESAAVPFVPDLEKILCNSETDEYVRRMAASDLAHAGAAALPALRRSYEAIPSSEIRGNIVDSLARLGPEAIPTLREIALRVGEDVNVRWYALGYFANLSGEAAESTLENLAREEPDETIRRDAARRLEDLRAKRAQASL